MAATSNQELATALVHEGWNHLQCQRPLAAWGSWRRALRIDPESQAAGHAISTLETAADLPAAARSKYRFRQPTDPDRRAAWDDRLRRSDTEDLTATADVFATLADDGEPDSAACYNRALCLAWTGENLDAIAALDRVVQMDAGPRFDLAVDAWTLAEVLRQGGGAETLADDLHFACTIAWSSHETAGLLGEFHEIEPHPHAQGTRQLPRGKPPD